MQRDSVCPSMCETLCRDLQGVFGCSTRTVILVWSTLSGRCNSSQLQPTYCSPASQTMPSTDHSQRSSPPDIAHVSFIAPNPTQTTVCNNSVPLTADIVIQPELCGSLFVGINQIAA